MTTRRGRSSDSGQLGTRAWRESIQTIKQELSANNGRLVKPQSTEEVIVAGC